MADGRQKKCLPVAIFAEMAEKGGESRSVVNEGGDKEKGVLSPPFSAIFARIATSKHFLCRARYPYCTRPAHRERVSYLQ